MASRRLRLLSALLLVLVLYQLWFSLYWLETTTHRVGVAVGSSQVPLNEVPIEFAQPANAITGISPASLHNPLCTRDELRLGQWVPTILPDGPPYVSKTTHLRCHPKAYYQQRPFPWFDWQPASNCTFVPWSAPHFCQVLQNATVSIIGDSLSWEMYSSLLQLLGQRVHQTDQHRSRDEQRNHVQSACHTTFVWRNDAYLQYVNDSIRDDVPDVLILNRGAHYVNDTTLTDDLRRVMEIVDEWKRGCRARERPHCRVFWRTTVPGTPGCNQTSGTFPNLTAVDYSRPNNDKVFMEHLVEDRSSYTDKSWKFGWYHFARQNRLVEELLGDRVEYLDAYDLNILRPDGHRVHQNDCLHNCYPGKMDVYNQLLLHALLR